MLVTMNLMLTMSVFSLLRVLFYACDYDLNVDDYALSDENVDKEVEGKWH